MHVGRKSTTPTSHNARASFVRNRQFIDFILLLLLLIGKHKYLLQTHIVVLSPIYYRIYSRRPSEREFNKIILKYPTSPGELTRQVDRTGGEDDNSKTSLILPF